MREDYEITIIGRQTIDAQTDEIQVDTLGDYTERGGSRAGRRRHGGGFKAAERKG